MGERDLKQVDGGATGGWIEPALGDGSGGLVRQQIPQIYEAYARIFHPACDERGKEVTWGEVARRLGTTAHREMQWHAIVGTYDYSNFRDSRWPGGAPNRAELDDEKLEALCAILASHTGSPQRCFFGVSTIHGGVEEGFPDAPLLEMPIREFVVLAGPLSAFDRITFPSTGYSIAFVSVEGEEQAPEDDPGERLCQQAPNLIWPEDRAWFVATEYDFDSTLIGGSRELIDAVLAAPELEAWEVDGEVSLQCDADEVNPVPDPPPGFDEPQDPVELQRDVVTEMLELLRGEIVSASVEEGVLAVEVEPGYDRPWRLEAPNADWSPTDLTALRSQTIERVELDVDANALRCSLSEGSVLAVTPREPAEDGDLPSWRVHLPGGMTLKHMHHWPWLLVDLP